MFVTIICSVMLMAGLFLMLLGGVGFVRDRRFFTSAPKDVQTVLQDKEERFPGQHGIRRLGRNQKRLWFHSVFHQVFRHVAVA